MVDINQLWARLERDLAALARLGGSELEGALGRLSAALEPAIRLRVVEALAQAGEELNALIPALRVKTLIGTEEVSFTVETEEAATEVSGELDARITLRLPEELKTRIEAAAEIEGLSLNAWLIKALARSTSQVLTMPSPLFAPAPPSAPSTPSTPPAPRHGAGRQLRGRGQA
jgi:hypothetical protein